MSEVRYRSHQEMFTDIIPQKVNCNWSERSVCAARAALQTGSVMKKEISAGNITENILVPQIMTSKMGYLF